MTAKEAMPSSCWGTYGKIAVVRTDGKNMPKQINPRHKSVKSIVKIWRKLNVGTTDRCAYNVALKKANLLADLLNE